MKTEQMETLVDLADGVLEGIRKCYDNHQFDTPNTDVATMLIVIHKQLISVIDLENK